MGSCARRCCRQPASGSARAACAPSWPSARGPADDRRHHGIPYGWRIEADTPPDLPASHAQFRDAAQRLGVHGGLCVPSIGSNAQPACVLLATTRPVDDATLRAAAPAPLLFSRYLHLACQPHILAHKLQRGLRLSPRENECLCWAACGKTAWEVGRLLEISEHTAIYHLRNAGLKLGAISRQQGVAEAMRQGILAPQARLKPPTTPAPARAPEPEGAFHG